ncbi:hypothetical protein M513_01131 [Trichuris suis]|uniref:Uncharacterized protein n=1 Tax=Trichuris suis TaxID=68888 RepID=A0A085ML02_9BILA|nr:hypothetical protein M513_01131 [Trichuris suis]
MSLKANTLYESSRCLTQQVISVYDASGGVGEVEKTMPQKEIVPASRRVIIRQRSNAEVTLRRRRHLNLLPTTIPCQGYAAEAQDGD